MDTPFGKQQKIPDAKGLVVSRDMEGEKYIDIQDTLVSILARLDKLDDGPTSFSDRTEHDRDIKMLNGRNIIVARGVGTKIGTETTQKLAFHGVTPVVQAGAISAPSGGTTVDSQARSAISSIITVLQNKGLTA